MIRFPFLSPYLSKRDKMKQLMKEILHWKTMTHFSAVQPIVSFKNNPVMVIEETDSTSKTGVREQDISVTFFENGKPSVMYRRVHSEFDVHADPTELKSFLEAGDLWGSRVLFTWREDGLLTEVDFASPERSWSNDKFSYDENRMMIQRYNESDWYGKALIIYTHLPDGKGYNYEFYEDGFCGEGTIVRAYIKGDHILIHNKLVSRGRILNDKKCYYNMDKIIIKDERKIFGSDDGASIYSHDEVGNVVLQNDSKYGIKRTVYKYDEYGNFTYQKTEGEKGYRKELARVIKY